MTESKSDLARKEQVGQNEKDQQTTQNAKEMEEIDCALKECGFGWFHILLLFTAAIAFCTGVIVTSSTAYILTSAECDLDMSLVQKGFLNGATYTGMLISTIPAGFLSDTFGRKTFLLIGFSGIFTFQVIGGLSQNYQVLVFAKFCEGVLFATSFNSVVTITAEFCYSEIRDRIMILQESFVPVSQVGTAILAWGVLVNDWEFSFFDRYIQLHHWNFYLLICSLFPLMACILYSFLPESPRYLLSNQQYDKARDVLLKIYKQNTGKPAETFLYYNIWREREKERASLPENKVARQMVIGFNNTKPLFKRPLGLVILLICVMQFLSMNTFNVIRLWYPQLSTIIENYNPGEGIEGSNDLCVMLDDYTTALNSRVSNYTEISHECIPTITGTETYLNTIILGAVCFIPYLVSGVLIQSMPKKYLICIVGFISFVCTLALRWASSKPVLVSLFSTDVALTQLLVSLFHSFIVECFPTTVRSLAIAVAMLVGRAGTLVGNVLFPILLSVDCVVPFFTLAGMMFIFAVLALFLPK